MPHFSMSHRAGFDTITETDSNNNSPNLKHTQHSESKQKTNCVSAHLCI